MTTPLRTLQQAFQNALRYKDPAVLQHIASSPQLEPLDRLQIYHTDYLLRLRDAFQDDYPALAQQIGHQQFDTLVSNYLDTYPPQSFTLRTLGDRLPQFLQNQSADLALVELAQLEWALIQAEFAPDAQVLHQHTLANINPSDWHRLSLQFHPSLHTLLFHHNTLAHYSSFMEKEANEEQETQTQQISSVPLKTPVTAIIWRNDQQEVKFRSLSEVENALFTMIDEGHPFSYCCESMLTHFDADEAATTAWVIETLQAWFADDLFSNYQLL